MPLNCRQKAGMKKVLVIVYYWPPSGGGGVQRWIKFTQYLPQFGWQPTVFAPKDADYPLLDPSLEQEVRKDMEVIRFPIFEPRKVYQRWMGEKKDSGKKASADEVFYIPPNQRSLKQRLSLWIRGNLFIPDARVLWVRPSVRFLKKYLQKNPVDLIITSGPPHSVHLIGRALKKQLGTPWLADFRDPWTDIEFYDKMLLTSYADKKHRRLEKAVLREADVVSMVTYYWVEKFLKMGAQRTEILTNGYDAKDFDAQADVPLSEHFMLSHVGTFANDRNPHGLWKVLWELSDEVPGFKEDLRIHLIGKVDPAIWRSLEDIGLGDNSIDGGYVDHESAVRIMKQSQVLLLLINQAAQNAMGRMTGKIFEYLASQRPILCIGPEESDPARVLAETGGGVTCDFENHAKLKSQILAFYKRYKQGQLQVESDGYQQFDRVRITERLARIMEEMVEGD
jgi:glycosyltransferase involved in cell wall biosynthesis